MDRSEDFTVTWIVMTGVYAIITSMLENVMGNSLGIFTVSIFAGYAIAYTLRAEEKEKTETKETPAGLEEKISKLEKEKSSLEEELDEKTTCPYCERDMDVGTIGGTEVKYGCYPPLGEEREEYSCEHFQENKTAYTVDVTTLYNRIDSFEEKIELLKDMRSKNNG